MKLNWLTQFATGILSTGLLLNALLEPALALKFTFEQRDIFSAFSSPAFPDETYTPGGYLTGEFGGEDTDSDQILSLNELTSFSTEVWLDLGDGVPSKELDLEEPRWLDTFSYNLNLGTLRFSAFFGSGLSLNSSINSSGGYIKLGTADGYLFFSNAPVIINNVSNPTPVPEPTAILGLASLAVLGLSNRVRRKNI